MMTTANAGYSPAARLGPNPAGGRDLVVGDVHGHFATLRHALAELEVGKGDRLFSIGDLVDRGPDSFQALSWIEGSDRSARFDLVIRGNHEQLMLDALASEASPDYQPLWPTDRDLWYDNGGCWWRNPERRPKPPAEVWTAALAALPFAARIGTPHGPVGLVHACPVLPSWEELEAALADEGFPGRQTRMRALWSRVRHRIRQPEDRRAGLSPYRGRGGRARGGDRPHAGERARLALERARYRHRHRPPATAPPHRRAHRHGGNRDMVLRPGPGRPGMRTAKETGTSAPKAASRDPGRHVPIPVLRWGRDRVPVGLLQFGTDGPRQFSLFRYAPSGLESGDAVPVAPDVPLEDRSPTSGIRSTGAPLRTALPGPVFDGAPDSWGRAVIRAVLGGGLDERDFLLAVGDATRQGALGYLDGAPLFAGPLARSRRELGALRNLVDAWEQGRAAGTRTAEALAASIGSLGGSRPKADFDDGGYLAIAKFTSVRDRRPVARLEVATLDLARRAGLDAARARLELQHDERPVAIVRRFDRRDGAPVPLSLRPVLSRRRLPPRYPDQVRAGGGAGTPAIPTSPNASPRMDSNPNARWRNSGAGRCSRSWSRTRTTTCRTTVSCMSRADAGRWRRPSTSCRSRNGAGA